MNVINVNLFAEHLNILLFDLAKSYHTALKRAEIALDFERKSGM